MYVCMYVCMYVYIYIYIYMYVCIHIYIYIYTHRRDACCDRDVVDSVTTRRVMFRDRQMALNWGAHRPRRCSLFKLRQTYHINSSP